MKHLNEIEPIKKSAKSTNKFLEGMFAEASKGKTENDAITFTRSGSPLLDFYAQAGAMRKNPSQALELFKKAFSEDREKALKILFYLRDVRGGQGERALFRKCLEWLGTTYEDIFEQVAMHIPEYGRWDDVFFDNDKAFSLIAAQLVSDKLSKTPSLLAKWMPTINIPNPKTRAKAKFFAMKLGLHEIAYRTLIRDIRAKIKLVEQKMSAQKWDDIDYSAVPSQAARIYKDAFKKHDEERYGAFVDAAEKGEKKINAGTLYPYQIYKSVKSKYSKTLEALWNQLPDYTQGKNALVVADVSGSMEGDPMSVSVSLALYFAERNKGQFKDYFITFSGNPTLQKVVGKNLQDKMNSLENAEWMQNTNLQKVFALILNTATKNETPTEELPSTIYIISDMEFDSACDTNTNFEVIKANYKAAGYEMPSIVFWNVDARSGKNIPVQKNEKNVALVSGFSPVIFKMAVENKSPEEVMMDTITNERYARITIT